MMRHTLTIREESLAQLRSVLFQGDGKEKAAVLICGLSQLLSNASDKGELRLLVREVLAVPDEAVATSSSIHITWSTDFFVSILRKAERTGGQVVIAHSHPEGTPNFSAIDTANEPELLKIAFNRNQNAKFAGSLVLTPSGGLSGRGWSPSSGFVAFENIRVLGDRFRFHFNEPVPVDSPEELHRQMLALGPAFNFTLSKLKIGVVGCGGTGSPTVQMLARLGVGELVLVDNDLVEKTNIHRLHGIFVSDIGKSKVEALKSSIEAIGFGTKVNSFRSWANSPAAFDALKSCDVVFGCTDDNSGRILLNRLAYFYLVPVIDMGLSIDPAAQGLEKLLGRVTVVFPGYRCLLCRNVIDPTAAAEEDLKRTNPHEHASRVEEAYVRGAGNPDPAVITFTTETSAAAINELIHRIQGFRGPKGSRANRVKNYYNGEDFKPGAEDGECELCILHTYSGRGDMSSLLDGTYVS